MDDVADGGAHAAAVEGEWAWWEEGHADGWTLCYWRWGLGKGVLTGEWSVGLGGERVKCERWMDAGRGRADGMVLPADLALGDVWRGEWKCPLFTLFAGPRIFAPERW